MDEFDYIVVGAGSAGSVIAGRLSEDPAMRVLLLEAGGKDDHVHLRMPVAFLQAMFNPRFSWGYESEPEPGLGGRRLWLPRGKVIGGSSSINGMFYMRGHPLDFEEWAQMGARGWGYGDVLPYFKRMETSWRGAGPYHGGDGPLHVSRIAVERLVHEPLMSVAEAAGFSRSDDLSGPVPEGFAVGEVTIDPRGRRASAATAYLKPALHRPNLAVRTGALVHRVKFEGRRATGIEYSIAGNLHVAAARSEVILCGGTFNSPHLLMLSGIGPGAVLAEHGIDVLHDNPHVGQNMSDHNNVSIEFEALKPITFLGQLRWDRLAVSALNWYVRGKGPLASQINSCNIVIRTDPSLDRPDVQFMSNPIRFESRPWFPGIGKRQKHVFWAGLVGLHPYSRGFVTLRSADPQDLPRVQTNLLTDMRDYDALRRGLRAARRIYRTGAQGELTGVELAPGIDAQSDAELDQYIRDTAITAQHPVGTCAMGEAGRSVVDPELKVRGVEGLRVVDASVMPTVPGGNTNAPTIMIAEKASDLIRGRTQLPREEVG